MLPNIVYGIYLIIASTLDFIGNGFVLYATIVHKAIKLDGMCIWIIQNLAVVDMANGLIILVPLAVSFMADNTWILGQTLCKVFVVCKYTFFIGNMWFITFMSVNKLLRCLFPLKHLMCTRRQKLAVTFITLVPMSVGTIRKTILFIFNSDVIVSYSKVHCTCISYIMKDGERHYLHSQFEKIVAIIVVVIPVSAMIISNSGLIVFAIRAARKSVNRRNILIVIFVTMIFVATFLPFFIFFQKYNSNFLNPPDEIVIASMIAYCSSFSNPFVYLSTNESFRDYTGSLLKCLFCQPLARSWTSISASVPGLSTRITSLSSGKGKQQKQSAAQVQSKDDAMQDDEN